MKSFKLTILILLCCLTSILAQKDYKKIKIYKAWVTFNNEPVVVRGVLYEVKDSSIIVTNSVFKEDYKINNFTKTELFYKDIKKISISRKNRFLRSIVKGTVICFVFGALLGLSTSSNSEDAFFSREESTLLGGVLFAIPGMIIGAVAGVGKSSVPISGDFQNFNLNRYKLTKYSIKGQIEMQH